MLTVEGRRRALLVSAIVVVELAAIGVRGTFAASPFWSEATNPASSVASGTLNVATTAGGVTCNSWTGGGASGNAGNCSVSITGGPFKPGQWTTVDFTVKNTGSLPAGDLSLYMEACSPSSTGICDAVELYVEETDSTFTTPTECWYPTPATASACAFEPFSTAGGAGTLTDFTNTYFSTSTGLVLSGGPPDLAANSSRYFVLGFELPTFSSDSIGNPYLGATATFDLEWSLNTQGP